MKNIVIAAVSAFLFSSPALAQQTLLGKYTGTFVLPGGSARGLTLEILSVEGDIVKGKAFRALIRERDGCHGEYLVEGTLKSDILDLRAIEKGGPAGDCPMRLRLTVEGNKLVGTMGKLEARLSR